MGAPVLIINGIELPQEARLEFQQTFERVEGGASDRRMGNGSLFTMQAWERWKTTISAGGYIPAPLLSLPRGVPFTVHCVAPVSLAVGEALPPTWSARTDWPEKSVTDKRGVVTRLVYPILTVVTLSGARLVVGSTTPQWELTCEEP